MEILHQSPHFHNIGVAIQHASQIERLLEERFSEELKLFQQETGKIVSGLGDKVKAVEIHLSDAVKKDLWVIVKIRNKVAHEATFGSDSIEDYIERCNRVISALKSSTIRKSLHSDKLISTSNISVQASLLDRVRKIIQLMGVIVIVITASIWAWKKGGDIYSILFFAIFGAGYICIIFSREFISNALVIGAFVAIIYVVFYLFPMTLRKAYEFFTDKPKATITSIEQPSSHILKEPQHNAVAKKSLNSSK